MKYSQAEKIKIRPLLMYLKFYTKHPNIEYLIKSGYGHLIKARYWDNTRLSVSVSDDIDWKSNSLLKMLRLSKTEFKMLSGKEYIYTDYIRMRNQYPKYDIDELINITGVYKSEFGILTHHTSVTGLSAKRLAKYLSENHITTYDYTDYLDQCIKLKYNLKDTAISMPRDFYAMHERLSLLIKTESDKKILKDFEENFEGRKQFEFEAGGLILRQPHSLEEILAEGRILHHCVGGYVDRHAEGKTNIFFIRKKSEPSTPYYTIEINNNFEIVQCRGYKNDRENPKPQEIVDFENQYKKFLEELKNARNHNLRTAKKSG